MGAGVRRYWRLISCAVLVMAAVGVAVLLWPMDTGRYLRVRSSGEMLDRDGRLLHAFLTEDEQWCFARDLEDISPHLVRATIAAEDQRFRRHVGVDPFAVARAAWQNLRHGRVLSGASTLTMQVVKQVDRPGRSLSGKAYQAIQAVRLDARLSKDEILWAYLNTAPYGLNLVGCEAASRRYFGKPASELTVGESALLAGLPKAPTALMPLNYPEKARNRRDYVLGRMLDEGHVDAQVYRKTVDSAIGAEWHAFPRLSPHLAMTLRPGTRNQVRLTTTLDHAIQENAEAFLKNWLLTFDGEITNGAVLVADVADASVLARVGSADFFHTPGGGQVDTSRAARSPGSALKPFTYALAMERNTLYACEMLQDGSLDYGLYSPENYDGKRRGLVSASYALKRSLNVPAVTVLDRVGQNGVFALLLQAGLTTLNRPAAHYGLGLTLGSCEVRLDQLVAAYCALANLGEYRALKTLAGDTQDEGATMHLLSKGTAIQLFDMLEHPLPDEFGQGVVRAVGVMPRVCWKTGTSTGHRDAWCFVFNRHYVVGVWMGNNDSTPSKHLVGARAALPLAARLFRSLPAKGGPAWPAAGDDLRHVNVCAATGLPASSWCPYTREVLLPREQYLHRRCAVHYPVKAGSAWSVAERWPGTTRDWDLAKIPRQVLAAGPAQPRHENLRILTPPDRAEFVLTGEPDGDRLRLAASTERGVPLHWYLDNRYLGESATERPLYLDLEPGDHKLTCMNPAGALDSVAFAVSLPAGRLEFKRD